jgi:hypothetical protein
MRGKTVVIPGGTSGIGRSPQKHSPKKSARIVLVARDKTQGHATLGRLRNSGLCRPLRMAYSPKHGSWLDSGGVRTRPYGPSASTAASLTNKSWSTKSPPFAGSDIIHKPGVALPKDLDTTGGG